MKKIIERKKQLNLEKRELLEKWLKHWKEDHLTFQIVGDSLDCDPTTISKEIKKRRTMVKPRTFNNYNTCENKYDCKRRNVCNTGCRYLCKVCSYCNKYCKDYVEQTCPALKKPPYVCNGCDNEIKCKLKKYFYRAEEAQKDYEYTLHDSRTGINMNIKEFKEYEAVLKEGLANGHSPEHIVNANPDIIPYSTREVYRHIAAGLFEEVIDLDLRKKVSRKVKAKIRTQSEIRKLKNLKMGHTYEDFLKYLLENPGTNVMEMDTVIGKAAEPRCLLTFMERNAHTSFAFVLEEHTKEAVVNKLDEIYEAIGMKAFKKAFGVILTDNGCEFDDVHRIEFDKDGNRRCNVFYCNPNASGQKGMLESEHRLYRYVLPKSTSFATLTQEDVRAIYNNINSYTRKRLNYTAPIKLALLLFPKKLIEYLGLVEIPANEVCLKEKLLKK